MNVLKTNNFEDVIFDIRIKVYLFVFSILFLFCSSLKGQSITWNIDNPNSWHELQSYLPEAKMTGTSVWVSLLPPNQMPPINPTGNYSEPYRLDYLTWAKEIAKLSLRYSNLKGYLIKDFQENVNLGYFRQTYIDSIGAAGISINLKLQFINSGKLHRIFYVDKNANGNGSGSSWTNASKTISGIPWNNVNGGDTIYISGGIDSTLYAKDALYAKKYQSDVIIAKSWEAGHNGDVYFSTNNASIGTYKCSFLLDGCQHIKLSGLTFWWGIPAVDDGGNAALYINNSDYCTVDNSHIFTDGNATCLRIIASSFISATNNIIETLTNSYDTDLDQDGITIGRGDGGHIIMGNKITLRGSAIAPHSDGIQFIWEGNSKNNQTIISNNFYYHMVYSSAQAGSAIYYNACYTNRLLIYNNVFVYSQDYRDGIVINGDPNYHTSLRVYNNTLVSGCDVGGEWIGCSNLDTLIVKNNIAMLDSSTSDIMVFDTPVTDVDFVDIDYNQYFINSRQIRMYSTTGSYTFGEWKALGYDTHSQSGSVNFVYRYGPDIADYQLVVGSSCIDSGTTISIFNTDINHKLRPQGRLGIEEQSNND